ncbi:MAG: ribonuclease III domain-containing protein [Candidatus Heimdallarchaeota archaeon]
MTNESDMPYFKEIVDYFGGSKKGGKYYVSAVSRKALNNEQGIKREEDQKSLATIGDSVLDLLAAERLFLKGHKTKDEISEKRKGIISNENLYKVALDINLQNIILWGSNEWDRKVWLESSTALADSMEALFGGLFLAKGYKTAKKLFDLFFPKEEY